MLLNWGVCWRRLLRAPWTARGSNRSVVKEISPEYSLKGLMLKLKLQHFGHLMQRMIYWKRSWCWERLKAGGEGDDRGWDGWMASLTPWTWVWASSGSWWWTGRPGVLGSLWLALKTGNQKNKINKIETSFFENLIEIGYSLVRLSRKKKEKTQITIIRNIICYRDKNENKRVWWTTLCPQIW